MNQGTIDWTRPKLDDLKKAYKSATEQGSDVFTFRDEDKEYELVTSYAKYLIEFLEGRLR